jgi:pimeloyl-ACP methyl ester carboxylesterase
MAFATETAQKSLARQRLQLGASFAVRLLILILPIIFASCATSSLQTARRTANIVSWTGPKTLGTRPVKRLGKLGPFRRQFVKPDPPSDRTEQVLRSYGIHEQYAKSPAQTIQELQTLSEERPTLEKFHALAELAFVQGQWARITGKTDQASQMFSTALLSSYRFLFDPHLNITRNAYDPQFRSIADIYNKSLEELLRILDEQGDLGPGKVVHLKSLDREIVFSVEIPGRWRSEKVEKFVFANDHRAIGMTNMHRTYGLGVPLIGVRERTSELTMEEHYPPGLTMSLTAFLDLNCILGQQHQEAAIQGKLMLLDPLEQNLVALRDRSVPLESDITTPMAYYMDDPLLQTNVLATFALLNANFAQQYQGIYMLEPFDPNKIPVVMVHGLWSSPVTWLQMFNDLRADRDIHEHYQFWFCLYPTGQPFWESARQVREDLANLDEKLAVQHPGYRRKGMILVGHSMGGLVSRMLTIHSRNDLWTILSDHPIESFEGDNATLNRLHSTFHFDPVPNVDRVITIGTPHRGSSFASQTTRWLGDKLITLPKTIANDYTKIALTNKKLMKDNSPLIVATSLDSLSPKNPLFSQLLIAESGRGVEYHNIVGNLEKQPFVNRMTSQPPGDGVVSLASARVPYAKSEIEINEEHSRLHQNPHAVVEVRRILLADLEKRINRVRIADQPSPLEPSFIRR